MGGIIDLYPEKRTCRRIPFDAAKINRLLGTEMCIRDRPISFARAALGGPIRIKTVDGEVEYDVRPGTQTDTKVRLKRCV